MKRQLAELNYRLKIRKALSVATTDELRITKEELKREFDKRNKQK